MVCFSAFRNVGINFHWLFLMFCAQNNEILRSLKNLRLLNGCDMTSSKLVWCCFNNLSFIGCVRTACPSLLTSCQRLNCWQLAIRLLSSADLLQVVPTTCYRPAIQQFVNKLLLPCSNLIKQQHCRQTCGQTCYKPVAKNNTRYNLRSNNIDFSLEMPRTNMMKRGISYSAASLWNRLPGFAKLSNVPLHRFKAILRDSLT
jgi:hypothetical protein